MPHNILFLSHDADLQGAERCLLDLVTRLDRRRFEPLVLLPWPGPLQDRLEEAGVPHLVRYVIKHWTPYPKHAGARYLSRYLRDWRQRLWSLMRLIEDRAIDLVYTNTTTVLDGALAARRAGVPHLWHIHEYLDGNPDLFAYLPHRWVDHLIVRLSDCIITPSRALVSARFPKAEDKVRVVPNGIDPSRFRNGHGGQVRAEFGIPADIPLITLVGAVSAAKDPLTFAQAAARIAETRPDVHFLLAGVSADPELEARLRAFIEEHGLSGRLHLLGFRRDVPDLLAATTVLVSTSVQETFGRTLIEAMALGKPVVATRCGGPEEVVADGETGFIVPPRDPEATAAAVLKLLSDPALAARMGAAGRKRVEHHFTAEAYTRRIEAVIEEALTGR